MGNIRTYRVGKKHGLSGIRAMAHRQHRQYDSRGAQESYYNGYNAGVEECLKKTGKVKLDYSQPLNNQVFK